MTWRRCAEDARPARERAGRRPPDRSPPGRPAALLAAGALLLAGCVGSGRAAADADYLRYVAWEVPGHEWVLLRWPVRRMPLRVHLPPPPPGLFARPEAIHDSVRDGVLDWTDVAAPGIPRFEFVDDAGEADIPIVWAAETKLEGRAVAFCGYDIQPLARRFGVSHILVTARWGDGRVADLYDVYRIMLHEMGHALGLTGHSPDSTDVMYADEPSVRIEGPSDRDRATLRALYARPMGSRVLGARSP